MELSQFSDYALRVLIYTGLHEERVSVPEIARAFGISRNHLVKVVHHLSQHGLIQTYRGRGGGFRLAEGAPGVTVAGVLRTTESFALVECLPPREGNCRLSGCCTLKGALLKARQAFLDTLEEITIADLLAPRPGLRNALNLPDPA